MELHKFEKTFRDELNQREISPAAGSWEKLSSQLEKEDKKSKSLYWATGIAASLTAAFLIFSFVFNNSTVSDKPALVEMPSATIENEDEKNIPQQQVPVIAGQQNDIQNNEVPVAKESSKNSGKTPVQEIAVASNKALPQKIGENQVEEDPIQDESFTKGLEEVIADVNSKLDPNLNLNEAEIDALLYEAAAEISRDRNRTYAGKVDAAALLMDVEMELDHTFRDRVFDLLKEGYLKARTAVANRNF